MVCAREVALDEWVWEGVPLDTDANLTSFCGGNGHYAVGEDGVLVAGDSEIDWMRFFWQFTSAEVETFADPNPGADPVPSFNEFFDLLDAAAAGLTPNYGNYHDAVSTMAFPRLCRPVRGLGRRQWVGQWRHLRF